MYAGTEHDDDYRQEAVIEEAPLYVRKMNLIGVATRRRTKKSRPFSISPLRAIINTVRRLSKKKFRSENGGNEGNCETVSLFRWTE